MSDDTLVPNHQFGRQYLLYAGTIEPKGGKFLVDATDINGTQLKGTVAHLNISGAPVELHDGLEVQGFLALVQQNRLILDPQDLSWVSGV